MLRCSCCQTDAFVGTLQQEATRLLRHHASIDLSPPVVEAIASRASEDLTALAERDPAAGGCRRYVWESYRSFRAVLSYRIAHTVQARSAGCARRSESALSVARQIAEQAKAETGVEIHPSATIGRRFVIDHGSGTVIGETVVIGNDCYLLQGVILGATGIASNPYGRRHPILGNRVQVGGFARVFGPVTIDDDVMIGSGAVVTSDVKGPARIIVTTQYQSSSPTSRARIFGVVPLYPGMLDVHGVGLSGVTVQLVDAHHMPAAHASLRVLTISDHLVRCEVFGIVSDEKLRLVEPGGGEVVMGSLHRVWRQLQGLELLDGTLMLSPAEL